MVSLALVGATGAVGREAIRVLEERGTRIDEVRCFASAKSAEAKRSVIFRKEKVCVEDLAKADFGAFDFAIFSVGSKASRQYAPIAKKAGCVVIDNSSAFRMDPAVPLVVPEINAGELAKHENIIANPNCTTAIALMAVYPLHRAFNVRAISVTSYQAASGAGEAGLSELKAQICSYESHRSHDSGAWNKKTHQDVFPQPIALNVFPHIGSFLPNGFTDEEMKILNEGRKILGHPNLRASTTCVRVPVERVHCMDVIAQCASPIGVERALEELRKMPGLDVFKGEEYPTPLNYAGKHNCAVSRVRADPALPNALRLWVLGDQLLKGAALNAVQILEHLMH